MKTLTAKIPAELEVRLKHKAKTGKETVSQIVRRALVRELESDAADFAAIAAPYTGMFRGPKDLSTRKGYGSRNLG
jgi:predicted transcriptional regulator